MEREHGFSGFSVKFVDVCLQVLISGLSLVSVLAKNYAVVITVSFMASIEVRFFNRVLLL